MRKARAMNSEWRDMEVDGAAARALLVVLESLGDEVDRPGHREGDEDESAGVHATERRDGSAPSGAPEPVCRGITPVTGVVRTQPSAE